MPSTNPERALNRSRSDIPAVCSSVHAMSSIMSAPSPAQSLSSSKRKSPGDSGSGGNKAKKTRQSQSCDACRARKVKCDRLPPSKAAGEAGSPGVVSKDICSHCQTLGSACTFNYEPKKRGPPNQYLRKLREQQASGTSGSAQYENKVLPFNTTPGSTTGQNEGQRHGHSLASLLAAAEGQAGWLDGMTSASPGSAAGPSGLSPYQVESSGPSTFSPPGMTPGSMMPPPSVSHSYSGSMQPSASPPAFYFPSTSRYTPTVPILSSNVSNPFDEILPRTLLMTVINLYFDYINALTPCLHKPSIMRDLQARREEREHPERDEWISLIMTTVAVTLVQMPRAFVPLPRKEVGVLARRCYMRSREYTRQEDRRPTVNLCTIRYFDGTYLYLSNGGPGTHHTAFAEAHGVARCLRLHDETTFENPNLSPLEREHGRRVFFLLFGADKSEGSTHSNPMWLREEDCPNLRLPEELDDDYISETRYMVQPPGTVSIMCGFNYITRFFILASRIASKSRVDRQRPPRGTRLQESLADVDQILDQTLNLMKGCPKELKLKSGLDSRHQSPEGDWNVNAFSDIRELFFDPKANRASARNVWLVQQANLYVTQQLIRFMGLRYRDELRALQREQLSEGMDEEAKAKLAEIDARRWADERDDVACALLDVLHTIPIQCIAVNGLSLVYKVRFVASTLLDTVSQPGGSQDGSEPPANVTRAQGYLWDFLSILSEIEKAYSMED